MTDHIEVVREALETSQQEFQHDPVLPAVFAEALAALAALEAELAEYQRALAAAQQAIRELPVITDEMEAELAQVREELRIERKAHKETEP